MCGLGHLFYQFQLLRPEFLLRKQFLHLPDHVDQGWQHEHEGLHDLDKLHGAYSLVVRVCSGGRGMPLAVSRSCLMSSMVSPYTMHKSSVPPTGASFTRAGWPIIKRLISTASSPSTKTPVLS